MCATLGCSGAEVAPERPPRLSDSAVRTHVDSLRAQAERRRAARAVAFLAEPPDFTGRISTLSAGGATSIGIEVELDPASPDSPRLGSGRVAFTLVRGAAWQGTAPLPLDSLRVGDRVRLWLNDGGTVQPIDPPLVSVAALQRVDSLR